MRLQALLMAVLGLTLAASAGCQDYPFEARPRKRVEAKRINEIIATVAPTDILFVVDNSGSMGEEIALLRNQVARFIEELSKSNNEFQIGLITTDVDCNVPSMDCVPVTGRSFRGCCKAPGRTLCQDEDTDGDGVVDRSNCDGGRLRAASTGRRIFSRPEPEPAAQAAFVAEFGEILDNLGTNGSSYEAGFEAARRAVACAVGRQCTASDQLDCCAADDAAVADLNAGFIRPEADLVVIFLTDEEDCSVTNRDVYFKPATLSSAADQATNFCSPDECYLRYARIDTACTDSSACPSGLGCDTSVGLCQIDADDDGVADWADANQSGFFRCGNPNIATYARVVNPPELSSLDDYIDAFVALKGGVLDRFRAAGIVGSVPAPNEMLGHLAAACVNAASGSPFSCGCWATAPAASPATSFYCNLTETIGQGSNWTPVLADGSGCKAMPSGRYVDFLEALGQRRLDAGLDLDTLVDTICRASYEETMNQIVNTVILTSCFDLGVAPAEANDVRVLLNNDVVPYVPRFCASYGSQAACDATDCFWDFGDDPTIPDDDACILPESVGPDDAGWTWRNGSTEICLVGEEFKKKIGDEFEIFLITGTP